MSVAALSRVRKSIVPTEGDDWSAIAHRHLAGTAEAEAVQKLQSWNLHVYMRSTRQMGQPTNPILPSDVIFIEPPLAKGE